MTDDNMRSIIERIKTRRDELGITYQELAERTGMTKSSLQRYETGAIRNIPLGKLDILASALEVTPCWLLGLESDGCPVCRNGEVLAWDLCNDAITIESDGKLHILAAGDWEAEISYCPKCGRKLSHNKEADYND